jgi:hypothetical protein
MNANGFSRFLGLIALIALVGCSTPKSSTPNQAQKPMFHDRWFGFDIVPGEIVQVSAGPQSESRLLRWYNLVRQQAPDTSPLDSSPENTVNSYVIHTVADRWIRLNYGAYDFNTRRFLPSKVLSEELSSKEAAELLFNVAARQNEDTLICFGDSGLSPEDEFVIQKRRAIKEIETELQQRGAKVKIIPPSWDFRWEGPVIVIRE